MKKPQSPMLAVRVEFARSDREIALHLASLLELHDIDVSFDDREHCDTLILLITEAALKTDWTRLDGLAIPYRETLGRESRFVPIVADECELPPALSRFQIIDWRDRSDRIVETIVDVIGKKPASAPTPLQERFEWKTHRGVVAAITMLEGGRIASVSGDTVVWTDVTSFVSDSLVIPDADLYAVAVDEREVFVGGVDGMLYRIVPAFASARISNSYIIRLCFDDEEQNIFAGCGDGRVHKWDRSSRETIFTICEPGLRDIAVVPRADTIITASHDGVHAWDSDTGERIKTYRTTVPVLTVAASPDGITFATATADLAVAIWRTDRESRLATLEGHGGFVTALAFSPNGRILASLAGDELAVWSVGEQTLIDIIDLENDGSTIAFSPNGELLVGDVDGNVSLWTIDSRETRDVRPVIRHRTAKVVFVGPAASGKTTLALRVVRHAWVEGVPSTHGIQTWPIPAPNTPNATIWIWDLAGQEEYRIIHQLFLHDTALGVVVFDGNSSLDLTQEIDHWNHAFDTAIGKHLPRFLIQNQIDRGGRFTANDLTAFCVAHEFLRGLRTSAKTGEGCSELIAEIDSAIRWEERPYTTTIGPARAVREAIEKALTETSILRISELRQRAQLQSEMRLADAEVRQILRTLADQSVVLLLPFGDFVLLTPALLDAYAAELISAVREHEEGLGCISERCVLEGQFAFRRLEPLPEHDHLVLLRSLVDILLRGEICFRETTLSGDQLVFPLLSRSAATTSSPNVAGIVYEFTGNMDSVYASVVVRLRYSRFFSGVTLSEHCATFHDVSDRSAMLEYRRTGPNHAQIAIGGTVPAAEAALVFLDFVDEHITRRTASVIRRYRCLACGAMSRDDVVVGDRIAMRDPFRCATCTTVIHYFAPICNTGNTSAEKVSRRVARKSNKHRETAFRALDNDSKELILIGHMYEIAGEAGQICRRKAESDHGIDMEVEFRNDDGSASGKMIYLQLKAGDSYLRQRRKAPAGIFHITKARHVEYWKATAYPVYLVLQSSNGSIRWMNVTKYLRERPAGSEGRTIPFAGENLDATALMRVRAITLHGTNS